MPFKPGQSGNLKGRPKKDRALTDLLERAGSSTVEIDGKRVSSKRYLADMVWQVVMTGEAILPGGKKVSLSPQDWKDFVKWIYAHIDGPPTVAVDMDGMLKVIVEYADSDDNPPETPPLPIEDKTGEETI